ncbi:hypothetical protein MMC22_000590 [Lobaria immixta]|nr:hypothetical protein [Lobaria immixta]
MHFLEDNNVFQSEKSYLLAFEPPERISKLNMTLQEHNDVLVKDIRGQEHDSIFDETGYAILNFQSQIQYKDFHDEKKINHIYLKEVAENLKAFLGTMRVQIYEHLLRKVDALFPISTGQ